MQNEPTCLTSLDTSLTTFGQTQRLGPRRLKGVDSLHSLGNRREEKSCKIYLLWSILHTSKGPPIFVVIFTHGAEDRTNPQYECNNPGKYGVNPFSFMT